MKNKDFSLLSKQLGGVSRRDFMKFCTIMAAGMGLPLGMGVKIAEVPVNDRARVYGKSKVGLGRTTRVLFDLLTVGFLLSYSARPMQLFGLLGFASFGAGTLVGLYLTALKLFYHASLSNRPLLWLAVLLIVIGVQFISMGLMAELVTRTYHETQNKPIYAVREIITREA